MANPFDDILATISDESDRQALKTLGEKHAPLKEAVMRQSDYSKKLNELNAEVTRAKQWDTWREENWDTTHNKTKAEVARDNQLAELQQRLVAAEAARGSDMTFEDLNKWADEQAKAGKFVSPDVLKAKEEELAGALNGTTNVLTRAMKLGFEHMKKFGEVLDPEALFTYANQNKIQDLDAAYQAMNKAKFDEAEAKAAAAREEQIRKDERTKVLTEKGMSQSAMPVDDGGPNMGHFQARLQGGGEKKDSPVPAELELGQGIGAIAARHGDRAEIEGRTSY